MSLSTHRSLAASPADVHWGRRTTRLFLAGLLLVTAAAPSCGAGAPTPEELARRDAKAVRVQSCTPEEMALFGDVLRAVIEKIPTLTFDPTFSLDPEFVLIPRPGGLDAGVNLSLNSPKSGPGSEIGDTAYVLVEHEPGFPGPSIFFSVFVERTVGGYRLSMGPLDSYVCSAGSCEWFQLRAVDVEVVAASLPALVAAGSAELDIRIREGSSVTIDASGLVEFDATGGGAVSLTRSPDFSLDDPIAFAFSD